MVLRKKLDRKIQLLTWQINLISYLKRTNMTGKVLINMKFVFVFIALFSMIDSFSQENSNLKHLLDSLKLDYNLTPNKVIKEGKMVNEIIWAGKIDSIDIEKTDNRIELFFYCNHRYFDNVSKDMILSRKVFLKNNGDGDFVLSIVSNNMTMEAAKKVAFTYARRSTNYIMTIGKPFDIKTKYGKKYVAIVTYYFYTFN
jgi:hypothetical protein